MRLKGFVQLILLFGRYLHQSNGFFTGKEFEIGKCSANNDGEIHVDFETTYRFHNFTTLLCPTKNCSSRQENQCEILQNGSFRCRVLDYVEYFVSLKMDYSDTIKRFLFLEGHNKTGSFRLAQSPITSWNSCMLRKCENTVPFLRIKTFSFKPDKVNITFNSIGSYGVNPPQGIDGRAVVVTLEDSKRNMSTILFSKNFSMKGKIPNRVSEDLPKCNYYNQLCVTNTFKYCTNSSSNPTLKTVSVKNECRALIPFYELPAFNVKQCIRSETDVTVAIEITGFESTEIPLYFLYNITDRDGTPVEQLQTDQRFFTFPRKQGADEDQKEIAVSLCNECGCSSWLQVNCLLSMRPETNSGMDLRDILIIVFSIVFVLCLLAGGCCVWWKRSNNVSRRDSEPEIWPADKGPEYTAIQYHPHVYNKPYLNQQELAAPSSAMVDGGGDVNNVHKNGNDNIHAFASQPGTVCL